MLILIVHCKCNKCNRLIVIVKTAHCSSQALSAAWASHSMVINMVPFSVHPQWHSHLIFPVAGCGVFSSAGPVAGTNHFCTLS